jgi:hypothetical protein
LGNRETLRNKLMNEHKRLDFLAAFGEEFRAGLWPIVGWENLVPQDAFAVLLRVQRQEPTPQLLSSLSDLELEQLRVESERYFECEGLTVAQIRKVIARTLARHPPDTA